MLAVASLALSSRSDAESRSGAPPAKVTGAAVMATVAEAPSTKLRRDKSRESAIHTSVSARHFAMIPPRVQARSRGQQQHDHTAADGPWIFDRVDDRPKTRAHSGAQEIVRADDVRHRRRVSIVQRDECASRRVGQKVAVAKLPQ